MENLLFTLTKKSPSEFLVEQRAKSNEQQAKSNEQRPRSNEQRVKSNEQQATSKNFHLCIITVKAKDKAFSQFLEDDFRNTRMVSLDLNNLHINFIPNRNVSFPASSY